VPIGVSDFSVDSLHLTLHTHWLNLVSAYSRLFQLLSLISLANCWSCLGFVLILWLLWVCLVGWIFSPVLWWVLGASGLICQYLSRSTDQRLLDSSSPLDSILLQFDGTFHLRSWVQVLCYGFAIFLKVSISVVFVRGSMQWSWISFCVGWQRWKLFCCLVVYTCTWFILICHLAFLAVCTQMLCLESPSSVGFLH
jgi:hypothetical protein